MLIETFITDWSRTITNCAIANATSGSHLFMETPLRRQCLESNLVAGGIGKQ